MPSRIGVRSGWRSRRTSATSIRRPRSRSWARSMKDCSATSGSVATAATATRSFFLSPTANGRPSNRGSNNASHSSLLREERHDRLAVGTALSGGTPGGRSSGAAWEYQQLRLLVAARPIAAGDPGRGRLDGPDHLLRRNLGAAQRLLLERHQLADADLTLRIDDHDRDKGLLGPDAGMDL